MRHFLAALVCTSVFLLGGCSSLASFMPSTQLVVLGEHRNTSIFFWERHVAERFPNAILIVGHGGTNMDGEWVIWDEINYEERLVKDVIADTRKAYPGRRIIMICCNPDGLLLDIPGVSYALTNVWMFPDYIELPGSGGFDEAYNEDEAGSLDEFIHNPW